MPKLDLRLVETQLRLGDTTYFTASIITNRWAHTHWLCERLWNATGPGNLKPHECMGVTRMRISWDILVELERLAPCHVGHLRFQYGHARVGRYLIVHRTSELPFRPPIVVHTVTVKFVSCTYTTSATSTYTLTGPNPP